jgi:hypothetical protein
MGKAHHQTWKRMGAGTESNRHTPSLPAFALDDSATASYRFQSGRTFYPFWQGRAIAQSVALQIRIVALQILGMN